jgi:hypothetical protein
LETAIEWFQRVTADVRAPAVVRVFTARKLGAAAVGAGDWRVALDGYSGGVALLDTIANRALSQRSREGILKVVP